MADMDFTPGPWTAFKDTCAQCEANGTAEWQVMGPPGGHHAQFGREADARLVAASPQLYAALQRIANGVQGGQSFSGTDCAEIAAEALAALAAPSSTEIP